MSKYLFIAGRHPELSLAELVAVFPQGKFAAEGELIAVDLDEALDQKRFDRLGGALKLAGDCVMASRDGIDDACFDILSKNAGEGKLVYAISLYGISERLLRPILMKVKKKLAAADISARFANKDFRNLTAAQYKGLGNRGVEIVVGKIGGKLLAGKVIAVQNIDAYSHRDYDKPFRDMTMGMMPPKLAQILLNLTGVGGVVWDPFCGSGTLVMEGLLAGKKMIGSDLDPARVEGARRNEAWLKKEFGVTGSAKFLAHDATLPFDHPFEAIAFEGDLGVPHGQNIRPDALRRIIQELEELYVQFFDNLKRMDFRGPVVAALPYFIQRGGGEVHLKKSIAHAERLGFKSTPFLQDPRKGERTTLKYSRAGQAVGREIFRWTRGAENSHSSF